MEYKSNHNIVYSCKYHIVWCPKYRRKVLKGAIATRLKELVKIICVDNGFDLIEIEVMPDHLHLLLEVDPQYGIHKAIKKIKGITSHELRSEFPELTTKLPSLWTNSYFITTSGGAPIEKIKQYIQQQETSQRK